MKPKQSLPQCLIVAPERIPVNKFLLIITIFTLLFTSCKKDMHDLSTAANTTDELSSQPTTPGASVATDWYKLQLRLLLKKNSSLANGVFFGYIGIGLYESVRNAKPDALSFSSKLYQMPVMPAIDNSKKYNWEISANAAMADLTRKFFIGISTADSTSIDSLENAYDQKYNPASDNFLRSQSYGKSIAAAIYNWRLADDINFTNTGYTVPNFPGSWVPTPPLYLNPPVLPFLGNASTYLKEDLQVVAPKFPVPYSEDQNSRYYKIAKELYDVSKNLTTEQMNIANFWVDQGDGIGYTPQGHDMSILTQVIEQENVNLLKAAEAYAKAGIAERDAAIICFKSKYKYTLVRPVSYIQKVIDASWLPFIVTPPHPEYPAAHALITGSVMQAASSVLGNQISFTDHTYDFRGWTPRSFSSLFDAAQEAGMSRLYGGIHYHVSIHTGLQMAKDIGSRIGGLQMHN